jgi:tetratricopeptide (TPR) repeat protein
MHSDTLTQVFELLKSGRIGEAEERLGILLSANASNAEANHLMGSIRFQQGRTDEALAYVKRAAASPSATAQMHCSLGALLYKMGNWNEAVDAYQRALAVKPGWPDAMNALADIYRADGEFARTGGNSRTGLMWSKAGANTGSSALVPQWHFGMMNDLKRNQAYEAAIRRAAPGKHVLDIGTGSGLLSMMAARAGASRVTACEVIGPIAQQARKIIAANGMSDRITVHAMKSTALSVPAVMPSRAEVLVTETFGSLLLSEEILPSVEHAYEYLLTGNATIIPRAGSIMGYLAGGSKLETQLFVDKAAGFDVSAFNELAPRILNAMLNHLPHEVLSEDAELIRFDLTQRRFPAASVPVALKATSHGVCFGVAQWIKLDLDADSVYENRPVQGGPFASHWTHALHRFARPVRVKPGDIVNVLFRHDRTNIGIDLLD